MPFIPNFKWYAERSKAAGLTPRCPIATAELCPRYYASLWLLGKQGMSTRVRGVDEGRLDKKWQPFKPTIAEEEPSITNAGEDRSSIHGFCPEVVFDRFGYFASSLGNAGDELDTQFRHEQLHRESAPADDPRWNWSSFTPRHFTECREYSIFNTTGQLKLVGRQRSLSKRREGLSPKTRWFVLARDAFTCQYCGRRPPEVVLEVDHKLAVANGGTNEIDNLFTACLECNRGKGVEPIGDSAA